MNWIPVQSQSHNWIILTFIAIATILAFVKSFYAFQLREFLRLPFNNKYIIIFGKKEKIRVLFTILLSIIQWFSISIIIFFLIRGSSVEKNLTFIPIPFFVIVLIGVISLFLLKLFVQRVLTYIFDIKSFANSYIFNRLSYSNYVGLVLCVLNFINIYGFAANRYFFYFSLIISLFLLIFGFFSFVKFHKFLIKTHFFYFILYLCTLEIIPYVFLGYLTVNN